MNTTDHNKLISEIRLSTIVVSCITCVFLVAVPQVRHWFVLPVMLCGILMCPDVIRWFSGKYHIFDLYGLFGIFGIFFFFLNPLLQIQFGHTLQRVPYYVPDDFRPWLGLMGCLNFLGLVMFFAVRTYFDRKRLVLRYDRVIDPGRFRNIMPFAIAVSFVALVVFWSRTGGVFGAASFDTFVETNNFKGTGPLRTFSDSLPILVFLYLSIERFTNKSSSGNRRRLITLLCIAALTVVLQFLVAGLRGSRADFIVGMIPMLIVIHYRHFRITRYLLGLGLIAIFIYGSVMGIYKHYRNDALKMFRSWDDFRALQEDTGRTSVDILLRDFGRSDIQALLCERTMSDTAYRYAYGETYLAGILSPIPVSLRPRFTGRAEVGTITLYGYYDWDRTAPAGNVYGIAGEAIMNFGILAAPFPFLILACLFSLYRKCWNALAWYDVRLIMLAFLLRHVIFAVMMDSDMFCSGLVKFAIFPCLVLWLVSVSVRKTKEI